MNIVEKLDLAIKFDEIGITDRFYTVWHNGKELKKQAYMANSEWKAFLDAMPETFKKAYEVSDGDEITEKNGRPPKMASFGSSSRMIYNLSHENKSFVFEKKLPTTVGGKANLDGFLEASDKYIFVEAKCHEPYSAKKNAVSTSYQKLYEYINERMAGDLKIDMTTSTCGRYMNTTYFAKNEKIERFDIKQMICHLLGIATGILAETLDKKKIEFIYLLYDPTCLPIDNDAKAIIDSIYARTIRECNSIDFKKLFRVILEFLSTTKFSNTAPSDIDKTASDFRFILASQKSYVNLIK